MVDLIITELAVFTVDENGLTLIEHAEGVSIDDIKVHFTTYLLLSELLCAVFIPTLVLVLLNAIRKLFHTSYWNTVLY